ncbi:MAG: YlxR family protein [Pseudomonadota bacterium]
MKKGHIPIRTCIACRNKRPASEMIRLAVLERALIETNRKMNLSGRGCYICPLEVCAEKASKKRLLQKALRSEMDLIPSVQSILKRSRQKGVCG